MDYELMTTTALLTAMTKGYTEGEECDTELTARCRMDINDTLAKGDFAKAREYVLEFFGPHLDISFGARQIIADIQNRETLAKEQN